MEVDRVSQMVGLGDQNSPAWPKRPIRRRKFVEEIPEDPESNQDSEENEKAAVPESNSRPFEEDGSSIDLLA